MKFTKIIYLFLALAMLFTACGKDKYSVVIDTDLPAYERQMVLHCFIKNTDSILRVGLSESVALLSGETDWSPINNGTVSLYEDGVKLCDYELDTSIDNQNYFFNNESPFGYKDGLLEIRATAPGFQEIVATNSFPDFVPLTNIQHQTGGYLSVDGSIYDKFEITFTDPPNVENYYEVNVAEVRSSCINAPNNIIQNLRYIESNDVHTSKSGSNISFLISDTGFDGQTYSLIFGANSISTNGHNVQVSWRCLSKAQFQYSKSLFDFGTQLLPSTSQPVAIFSNVDNGIGIFGCAAHQMYKLSDFENYAQQTLTASFAERDSFQPCGIIGRVFDSSGTTTVTINASEINRWINIRIQEPTVGIQPAEVYFSNNAESGFFENQTALINITKYDEINSVITGSFNGLLFDNITGDPLEIEALEFDINLENP